MLPTNLAWKSKTSFKQCNFVAQCIDEAQKSNTAVTSKMSIKL